ncbi:hypothetical protein GS429_16140 [Natronorubrum sp. JWXQ-INN-674]|uniref:Molybdopterin cofactor biosynthesis MoaD-related C-terminal domain-containing protein n=1 Tax=Natronorubrum halalkaliphilum TaxID=2691917 RepID=A0A6B0VPY1_9EURY|nr:hypothetical protein [Natronorubrum halalkaliphilum]MXV63558.1 hypothetical protein [Natronorubrum halalkaliphilum]
MTTRIERSFRGISERLVVRYLTNLGGERIAKDTVEGEDWTATFSSETVAIGPSLTLTEVTIVFEEEGESEGKDEGESGETNSDTDDSLESLVDKFAQKAMRAGG